MGAYLEKRQVGLIIKKFGLKLHATYVRDIFILVPRMYAVGMPSRVHTYHKDQSHTNTI